jgi:Methylamine utilisation protein MauE
VRFLGLAVTVAMAGAFLWAGLEKARSLKSFASLLRQLGIPKSAAPPIAVLVVALELSVAVGLMFRPSPVTLITVVGLATAFAFSGLIAIRQNRSIRCGCFGPYGASRLGKAQLVAFPLWLGGAALLWFNDWMRSASAHPTWLPAVVALTTAGIRTVSGIRAATAARGDRRSAREMLVWLNR